MTNGLPDADAGTIVRGIASGMRISDVAQAHGMRETDVLSIIDQCASNRFTAEQIKRELLCEVARLDALLLKFYRFALVNDDIAAGTLYVKLQERKATLTGMNATPAYAVIVVHSVAPVKRNSTQEIHAGLDELLGSQRPRR